VFISNTVIPTPLDKAVIADHVLLLALQFLMPGRLETMYVALVARLLTSLLRLSLAPFSVMFVLVFVDSFCSILKVRPCKFFPGENAGYVDVP